MSEELQGFDAYICHPQFGNEVVRGRFILRGNILQFISSAPPFILPLEMTAIDLGDANDEDWINLGDRRQPELQFTVSSAILDDDRFVRARPIRRQLQKLLGRRELFRRAWLTLACLLAFAAIAWLASVACGWGVRSVVKGISVQREIEFGDAAFKKIEPHVIFITDTNVVAPLAAVAALQAVAAPLLPAVPLRGVPSQFYIALGGPNAFALPGGRIVVMSGLLDILTTPEQLDAVLAHELAHVAQRHAFQHIISGRGPIYLLEILIGSRDKALNVLAFPSELLIYESFSQRYEKEADDFGWDYLVAARINPHGMIEAFQKLRAYKSEANMTNHASAFSSHPDLDRRIQWLEAKWAALPDKTNFLTLTNPLPVVKLKDPSLNRLLKLFR